MTEQKVDTLVTFLLDCSGPMEEIRDNTIKAFNSYLDVLKTASDRIEFTLILFNSEGLDQLHICRPVGSAPHLTRETYAPRAQAPLIDATYWTLLAVAESLRSRVEKPKVVISILSGGLENCSITHTWAHLRALIEAWTAAGWQFHFLGAGIDASDQGDRMGIDPWQILRYDHPSPEKTDLAFRLAASSTVAFANEESRQAIFGAQQLRDIGVLLPPVILP